MSERTVKWMSWRREIAVSPERLWRVMTEPDTYREWTAAFTEGSHYEGSWEVGERIRFLAPNGDGMVATIAENRPFEFLSIKHLGFVAGGVDDFESDAVRFWAPAFENYTFRPTANGTELVIDQEVAFEFVEFMDRTWPLALDRLQKIAEAESSN